ncbi:glycoside hydrolase family 27 protein [Gelatoporia subvermispora B]|uniref:Alpha-galactosidase n=1 Tax=Ceriporiopsis subvermispora (strain B) TaxID=914234 RepID=M2QLD9_CERS8|nr:glycoside hydrolase family 27 protein [Gelatoporia subvermispora B]
MASVAVLGGLVPPRVNPGTAAILSEALIVFMNKDSWACIEQNSYYSQCLPASSSASSTAGSSPIISMPTTSVPTTSAPTSQLPTSTSSASLTGIAASAPTTPPSKLTGKTPALGWNSWNAYGCEISEEKVIAAANQFISLGLKDAGYEFVNIDDCWSLQARNSTTQQIIPDSSKFPNGISSVASQVHALGLKLGIYGDAGTETCSGFPGSLGYENLDASTFADWGVDYLKYDNCNVPGNWSDSGTPQGNDWYNSNSAIRYRQMGAALAVQSNPMQFNLCIWGNANVWQWGARVGHSWRMGSDSSASWSYITSILTQNVQYLSYIDFWAHNDMDMMEIGNGDLTIEEQRTHFAAWCFLKSPILLGTDLSLLSTEQIAIITNTELLAFHQDDTIGTPAMPFTPAPSTPTASPPEFYAGPSSAGTHVFVINTSGSSAAMSFDFVNVPGLANGGAGSFVVHDMWAGEDVGTFSESYSTTLSSHDTAAFLLTLA